MLAGAEITDEARAAAERLIKAAVEIDARCRAWRSPRSAMAETDRSRRSTC